MHLDWTSIRSLYFDLDNTLIDHSAAEERAFVHCFHEAELHRGVYSVEALLRRYRVINEELWTAYRSGHVSTEQVRLGRWEGVLKEQFATLPHMPVKSVDEMSAMYLQRYDQSHVLMDGAEELIEACIERFDFVGLITNGFPEQVRQKLEHLGWTQRFNAVVISEVVGVAKPNARIFEVARDLSSTPEQHLVYVGDNYEVDMIGAKRAGWNTVWFDRHMGSEQKNQGHADVHISDLRELMRTVRSHSSRA